MFVCHAAWGILRTAAHEAAAWELIAGWTRAGGALAPAREDLLTQQGGALVLGAAPERRIVFRHADRGILGTVDVDALLQAAQAAKEPQALPGA